MNRQQPIFNRNKKPQPPKADPDGFLKAAQVAKCLVSVFFLDGEAIPFCRIKRVDQFSLVLDVEGVGDVFIMKNGLKKIQQSKPGEVTATAEFTE